MTGHADFVLSGFGHAFVDWSQIIRAFVVDNALLHDHRSEMIPHFECSLDA